MAHSQDTAEAVDMPSFDDPSDAVAAIAQNLDGTLEDEDGEPVQEDLDDEQQENPDDMSEEESEGDAPDDEVDEQEEEQAAPAIDAPASLNAEEKELFTQLPAEAQQFVKGLETRRTTEVQKGLEKARTAQQQAELGAVEKAATVKQQAAEQLYALANAYAPQLPDPAIAQHDPGRYTALKAQYDASKAQHDQVVQQAVQQFEAATQEQQQVNESFIAERDKGLMEIPEVANPETRGKFFETVLEVAETLGFDRELVIQNGDASDFKALNEAAVWKRKAEQLDAINAKKMKSVRKAKSAKSNAAQPKGSGKRGAFKKARQNLRQSGDFRDAAAAIAQLG